MRNRCCGREGRGWSRWTMPREGIMNLFRKTKEHLSADDVFLRMKKEYPGVGIATVYRNLEMLHQQGLLNRLQFSKGRALYEIRGDEKKDHHHHLVCRECGRIVDYDDFLDKEVKLFGELEKELSKKHNFEIKDHQVEFFGLCAECK